MAATVISSSRAVEVSLYVVRAFVRFREAIAEHQDLAARPAEVERRTEELALSHDVLSSETRIQLKQAFDAIRELMKPPGSAKKRSIGSSLIHSRG